MHKYQPYLFGVYHENRHANEVTEKILSLSVKSVGIEHDRKTFEEEGDILPALKGWASMVPFF